MDEDILIVGAGPVGLTAALWLERLGHRFTIVDRAEHGSELSKALALHVPSLETFERLGVIDDFLSAGRRIFGGQLYDKHRIQQAELWFDEVESIYHFILSLEQATTERILRDALADLGEEVRWQTEVAELSQTEDHVEVTYASGETSRHRWVIGCDGARSVVRRQSGVEFDGEKHPEWFVLADVRLEEVEKRGHHLGIYLGDDGLLLMIPLPEEGTYRVVFNVGEHEEAPTADQAWIERLLEERGPLDAVVTECGWTSAFQVRRRLAANYRSGRVFLAGDAAHTHSPIGGRGMNTGIGDVSNLCWKLDLFERGRAGETLLDSYEEERRPVGRRLTVGTQLATNIATSTNPLVRALRDTGLSKLLGSEFVQGRAGSQASMTGVSYRSSVLGEARIRWLDTLGAPSILDENPSAGQRLAFAAGPKPGERAPDVFADGFRFLDVTMARKHTLMLFDGQSWSDDGYYRFEEAARWLQEHHDDRVDVTLVTPHLPEERFEDWAFVVTDPKSVVHNRYGSTSEAAYLIRPDGYIAWRAQPFSFQELRSFLHDAYGW